MTRQSHRLQPACLAATLLLACTADTVDLGNDKPSAGSQSSLVAYAGSWTGHAEAYPFRDGSDRVRISIDAAGNGTIEFGASPPLPPPDTTKGYPTAELELDPGNFFVPGFAYPILEADVEDSRLRVRTSVGQVFKEWCGLFTPQLDPTVSFPGLDLTGLPPQYRCPPALANIYGNASGDECFAGVTDSVPVECGLQNCGAACECDAEACVASDGVDILFDGALEQDGERLIGTLVKREQRITVRLTRD